MAFGGAAGTSSLLFVYSLDHARTRLANDAKSAKGGGQRQFNGLVDVYKKTLASDGIAGLYRCFVPPVVGIVVYHGLYFGVYDSLSECSYYSHVSRFADRQQNGRSCWRTRGLIPCLVRSWMGSYHWCWPRLISS